MRILIKVSKSPSNRRGLGDFCVWGLVCLLGMHIATAELDAQVPSVKSNPKIANNTGGFGVTLTDGDKFGVALGAIGDLDGDGVQDFVVGANSDDTGGSDRGAVYVLFMNSSGTVKSNQKIANNTGGFGVTLTDGDAFGSSITRLGDLDNDGVEDLAVGAHVEDTGGTSRGAVWVLFMNSSGTVKSSQKIADSTGGFGSLTDGDNFGISLAGLGDVDGDGVEDLAVGAQSDDTGGTDRGAVYILFLNTNGTVKSSQKIANNTGGFGVTLSDSDRFGARAAKIGDLDDDGVVDLVIGANADDTGGTSRGAVYVLFLNSNGTVKSNQKIANNTGGFDITLTDNDNFGTAVAAPGDLDGDAVEDVAVGAFFDDTGGTDRGAVYVLLMKTDGTVKGVSKIANNTGGFNVTLTDSDRFGISLAAADIDGDGVVDLVSGADQEDTGGTSRGAVFAMFLQISPTITSISPTSGKPGSSVTITGKNFSTTTTNNRVLFGGVKATVTAASTTSLTVTVPDYAGSGPVRLFVDDQVVESDALFISTYDGVSKSVSSATYQVKEDFTTDTTPLRVAIGDIDGDGLPDVAVTNQGAASVSLYRNAGKTGGFNATSLEAKDDFTTGTTPQDVAIADIDGDGKPEVIVSNQGSNSFSVFENTATSGVIDGSTLAARDDFSASGQPRGLVVADFDGDARLDVVLGNNSNSSVQVFRNTSTEGTIDANSFAAGVNFTVGSLPRWIAAADFDGDGKTDIVAANSGGTTVSVLRNTATPGSISSSSFETHDTFSTVAAPTDPVVGDFDGDGKIDIATANSAGTNISVLRNTATSGTIDGSSFASASTFAVASAPSGIATGDVDGDGKLDLVASNNSSLSISILENSSTSGSISFGTKVDFTVSSNPVGVAVGDLTKDGRPEIIAANSGTTTISVLGNVTDPPTITSISPTSGKPGDSITISGTSFDATADSNTVFFDPIKATVTAATATQLTVTVPDGAGYGPLHVITAGRFGISDKPYLSTYAGIAKSISTSTLASRVTFATGTTAFDTAIGDLDGDGKPDLVVTNNGDDDLSVYRNTSTEGGINGGSFAAKADFATGVDPIGVTIHDIDGDGKPELLVANNGATSFSVLRNTSSSGSISFDGKVDFTANGNPTGIIVDDFDGDGKPDVALNSQASSLISVHRNTSVQGAIDANSFATKVTFATGSTPQGLTSGDIDGDGKPELLAANSAGNSVSILRNTATAGTITSSSFATKVDYTAGTGAKKVALVDGDGDGKLDVVVANNSAGTISVFINQATSGTIDANSLATKIDISAGSAPTGIDFADFDGDGLTDIAIADDSGDLLLFENNTSGSSVSLGSAVTFSLGVTARDIAVADLDGDDRPEVVIPNLNSTTVSVFHNIADPPKITSLSADTRPPGQSMTINGTGFNATASNNTVYFDPVKATVTAASTTQVTVTVPDGAGYGPVGVLQGSRIGMSDTFLLPSFNGFFQVADSLFSGSKTDYTVGTNAFLGAAGDLDGDGKVDLAVANNSGGANSFSVLRNTSTSGSASFASKVDFTTNSNPWGISIADFDGDGKLDVVTSCSGANVISVFRNTGSSGSVSFAAKVDFTTNTVPLGTTVEDFDGDGKLDIAVVGQTNDVVSVFRNTSVSGTIDANSFAAKVDFTTGDQPDRVTAGDVDGDGKPELLVSNAVDQTVSVFRNTATPGTISSSTFATKVDFSSAAAGLVLGDLDGDDKLDLVSANGGNNTISVLRNTATSGTIDSNTFATKVDLSVGSNASTIRLADLDGDGRPEILVTNRNSTSLSLFKNKASSGSLTVSSFGSEFTLTTGTTPVGLAAVDFDGDDKPDIAAVNFGSNSVSVYQNLAKLAVQNVTVDSTMADPQGVTIRIVNRDSGDVLAIGDSLRVEVVALPGVTNLDTVIIGLSTSAEVLKFGNIAFDTLFAPSATSSSADTFAVNFGITAGDTQLVSATNIAVARVNVEDDMTGFKQLDNQSTFQAVDGLTEFGLVGDRKRFGVDGRRPRKAAFDSVMIDTAALPNTAGTIFGTRSTSDGADGSTQSVRSVKIGDEIKLLVHVNQDSFDITDIDSVKVYLVDLVTSGYQVPDSAFYTMGYKATNLLATGVKRDSFIVGEGTFASGTVKDNVRIGALGFFQDKAGNLSAATDTASSASAFSLDVHTVADTRRPVVTPIVPASTGDRFTGLKDTTQALLKDDGDVVTGPLKQSPLSLKTDEGTMSVLAIAESDTAVYAGGNASDTLKFATTDSFTAPPGKISGATIDLTLSVKDSVGNTGTASVTGVILDQEMPVPKDLFPASSKLDTAVITDLTRHPRFRLSESVDTIGVRFAEVTTGTRDIVNASVGSVDSGLVVVTVTDSLEDDTTYLFQVLTRDLAGNTFLSAVDTLTFDAQFVNPMADSFVVTLDSTLTTVDSVIAGVNLPIKITAIDTALSNAEGKPRSAVTFNSDSVTVRVVADSQDVSGVRWAGTGVTDNGDGSATLDGEGWSIGKRTVKVKSEKTLDGFGVVVEYGSVTGEVGGLTVDAAEFRSFNLSVVEDADDGDAKRGVSGAFGLIVEPADRYGNASLRVCPEFSVTGDAII